MAHGALAIWPNDGNVMIYYGLGSDLGEGCLCGALEVKKLKLLWSTLVS